MSDFDCPPNLMPTVMLAAAVLQTGKACDSLARKTVGQFSDVAAAAQAPEVNHGP